MSHFFDTGFTVRQPAWHGLGQVLDDAPKTISAAREAAGLTWEPRKVPCYQQIQELVAVTEGGDFVFADKYVAVPDAALIERDDTSAVIGSGVTMDYQPILNQTMFEVAEALTEEGAEYDTGGSIRNGSVVWCLLKLDEPFTLPGDNSQCYPYVSVVNYHNGSGSMRAQRGSVRIVCQNTVNAAELQSTKSNTFYTFRHTANVMERIDEAKLAIAGTRSDAVAWQALASELLGLKVDAQSYRAFIDEFIPFYAADVVSERVKDNIVKARKVFQECYDGETNDAAHGTGLALVNAGIEYLDHLRAYRNNDTYLTRTLLRPEPLKAKVLSIVREVCSV